MEIFEIFEVIAMPNVRCNVSTCNNRIDKTKSAGMQISYHRFPKDPRIRKEWTIKCKRAGKWNPDMCRICSVHFAADDFIKDFKSELMGTPFKRMLKKDAIPSQNLPSSAIISESVLARRMRILEKATREEHNGILRQYLMDVSAEVELPVPAALNEIDYKDMYEKLLLANDALTVKTTENERSIAKLQKQLKELYSKYWKLSREPIVLQMSASNLRMDPTETVFFLCDMQEKFKGAIKYFDEIVQVANKLVTAGKILSIPLVVTEQYPKGLGSTVSDIDISHAIKVIPKTKFSMVVPEVEELLPTLCSGNLKIVVLFGVEAHVCIEQTALDLLERGYQVHIVADASSSRSQEDRTLAFRRLQSLSCQISTSESIIFRLLKDKENPKFNEIRALVKQTSPNTGLE